MAEDNIHAGHRERLTQTVYDCGYDKIGEIQALEYVLFYIFPRGDVNPLAHRLLDRYHSLSEVLEAPVEDLMMVKGMGKQSAIKLHLILEIFNRYTENKFMQKGEIKTLGEIYDFLDTLLRFSPLEEFHIIGITSSGKVKGHRLVRKGKINTVAISPQDISLFVATYKVPAVIIAHNHPNGYCTPSTEDISTNSNLDKLCQFADIHMIDDLIIGSDGIYSLKSNTKVRNFCSNQSEILDAFNSLKNK